MKSSGARVHTRRWTPSSRSRLVLAQVAPEPAHRRPLVVRRQIRKLASGVFNEPESSTQVGRDLGLVATHLLDEPLA
jgi:hypothetical protein